MSQYTPNASNGQTDASQLKMLAFGRWPEILASVGGIAPAVLDGKHHPCPKCGGRDRFRMIDAQAGALRCNKCLTTAGDGLASIQWALGVEFSEAIRRVSDYLGGDGGNYMPAANGNGKHPAKAKDDRTWPTADDAVGAMESTYLGTASHRWDYADAQGELLAIVLRWNRPEGKTIRQLSRRGNEWVAKGMDGNRPPLNAQAITNSDGPVYIFEGETCCDAAASIDLLATTSLGGSNAPDRTDWSLLRGRDVRIFPDNDPPGGKYAAKVARILTALDPPAQVRIVDLPGLPDKGDIVDWLENRDAAEPETLRSEIETMAAAADVWQGEGAAADIRPMSVAAMVAAYPTLGEPIIDGMVRRCESGNVIAPPKAKKSWLVYGMALSAATGRKWLGYFQCQQSRVLVIDNELHPATLASRIPTVAEAMSILPSQYSDRLDVLSLRGRLLDLHGIAKLVDTWEQRYDLVILDAWYRALPVSTDENSNGQITYLYNRLDELAKKMDCAWINVHHASKGGQGTKGITDVGSGAGSQSRAADCHAVLREHEDQDCAVLEAAVRSFAPVPPIPLRWSFPIWKPDCEIDPRAIKGRTSKAEEKQRERDQEGVDAILEALDRGPATRRQLRTATGLSPDRLNRLLASIVRDGKVAVHDTTIKGQPTQEYWIPHGQEKVVGQGGRVVDF